LANSKAFRKTSSLRSPQNRIPCGREPEYIGFRVVRGAAKPVVAKQ